MHSWMAMKIPQITDGHWQEEKELTRENCFLVFYKSLSPPPSCQEIIWTCGGSSYVCCCCCCCCCLGPGTPLRVRMCNSKPPPTTTEEKKTKKYEDEGALFTHKGHSLNKHRRKLCVPPLFLEWGKSGRNQVSCLDIIVVPIHPNPWDYMPLGIFILRKYIKLNWS